MDMSMYGNDIFAKLMWERREMSQQDYETYKDVSKSLQSLVEPPKLMVYLQCKPEVTVQRIMKRGRASELQAPLLYWFHLNRLYQEWYREYNLGKKILINVEDIDFISHEDEEDYILDLIMEEFNND
jgi:deoxyadenosine/deoxycytidine kinase